MPFDLTESIDALSPTRRNVASERVAWVQSVQRQLGMEPRNDSLLTYKYAIGEVNDDDVPSTIAKELVFVDELYRTSNYGAILEEALRAIAEAMKRKYNLPWAETWEVVRFYGPTMIKLYCVRQRSSSA